jgi:CheY-like chemotaxis protein
VRGDDTGKSQDAAAATPPVSGAPTVLVADDMSIVREPIAASLRAAGYVVVAAADGKEAVELIQSHRPRLILLDLNMPVLDGLGVMRSSTAS